MKKSIELLIVNVIIVFFFVLLMDFRYLTKFGLVFIWSIWSVVIAMSYAIITREEVDCRCFEEAHRDAVKEIEEE